MYLPEIFTRSSSGEDQDPGVAADSHDAVTQIGLGPRAGAAVTRLVCLGKQSDNKIRIIQSHNHT